MFQSQYDPVNINGVYRGDIRTYVSLDGINVIEYVRDEEHYIFVFRSTFESRVEVLQAAGRLAINGQLKFDWEDASVIAGRLESSQRTSRFAD